MRIIIGLLVGFTALFAASSGFNVFGQETNAGSGWFWWMILILIVGVVGAVMIIGAILYTIRSRNRGTSSNPPPPTPRPQTADQNKEALKVLGDRYIRGEITEEEYKRMKKEIG
ncbi:MAG: DUF6479 family protein [Methanomassiliicoccales archaeon]|nr:DUF6479 family protein [Methanomassiliicoccales archaeon]